MKTTQLSKIMKEFETWKKDSDKILSIKDVKISGKTKYKAISNRKEIIENMYFIKEGEDIIISGGTILWLWLGGTDEPDEKTEKLLKNRYYNNYLEEMKIRHRLKLFDLSVKDFDRNKLEQLLK